MTAVRPRYVATRLGWLGLACLAGCLSVPPDSAAPVCESNDDCDRSHGEVCEENVCWGNPPVGPFAALISPPSTRHDLVPREVPLVEIPDTGWIADLALDAPVLLSGRIVRACPPPMVGCDATTLGATVSVSRGSQFPGGPGFKAVANVESGASSFSIPVPRTRAGDDPYIVTVVPEGGDKPSGGRSAAERVPPLRIQVSLSDNTMIKTELGGLGLPIISGTLRDSGGLGLANYRVAALGRWDLTAPPIEVSSVDFTDSTGAYEVTLSDDLVGTVELIARPNNPAAPTVHITNIDAVKSATCNADLPISLGVARPVTVEVNGLDPSGGISPVSGALVSVTGVLTQPTMQTSFTVTGEQVTGSAGTVSLNLLDGPGIAGSYRLSVTPPADSQYGVLFNQALALAAPLPMRLPSRVLLRGTVVDSHRKPLANVAVTARPSLRFLWTLNAAPQAFVAAIPAATAVTFDKGDFSVWVDSNVDQVWGHYDLLIEPPAAARAPTYVNADVEILRDSSADAVSLGEIMLPDAAFVHGRITTPTGIEVEKAELKLYMGSTTLGLCGEVAHAPTSCPIPAVLQGRGTSDAAGLVRLALPR